MGTINVIFATSRCDVGVYSGVMFVASKPEPEEQARESKKIRLGVLPTLGFLDEDKIRTFQPHNDALVVTLRIRGYDVKRVLVD